MVAVLAFGVLGYWLIADYSWVEAFYMTIITVTTVGFGEIRPLGTEGKVFTVILIILSVFIFAFALSVITEYILSRNSLQLLKKKKVKNQIDKLQNHVVVCGFGRNGMQAAERLTAYKKPFVIIERDREIIEKFEDEAQKESVLRAFTRFTYELHEKNIEFLDHSPGNTLIQIDGDQFEFFLVDLNRMNFKRLDFKQRMKNFARLTPNKEMIKIMANEYAIITAWNENEVFETMWGYTQEFQEKFLRKKRLKKKLKFWKK